MTNRHRQAVLLTVPLIAILAGWYATTAHSVNHASASDSVRWVRTADGWERAWWLRKPISPAKPLVHPALMATAMLLGSAGLLALSRHRHELKPHPTGYLEIAAEDRL